MRKYQKNIFLRNKKVKKKLSSEKNFQRNSLHVSLQCVNNFKYTETTE